MDIMELGAIGEFVSGIAVIGSLLYVGLQVRQSNRLEKAESVRAVNRDYVSTLLQGDPPLFRRAMVDFESLPKDEQARVHSWLVAIFSVARTEVALRDQNLAEEGDYPQVLAGFTRSPGIGHWWKVVGPTFGDDFQRFIAESVSTQEIESIPAPHEFIPWLVADTAAEEA